MSTPETNQIIRNERRKRADGGEPLHDDDRSLFQRGGSIAVTLTAIGRDIHGLDADGDVTVMVYPDGIWIEPEVGDE